MKRKTSVNVKRCPECKSKDIYKRSRAGDITPREKSSIDTSRVKTKTYRCIRCNHEFDNPIVDLADPM